MKYYAYKVDKKGALLNESYGVVDPYYGGIECGTSPQRHAYENFLARRISRRNSEYEAVLVLHAPCRYKLLQDGMGFDYWLYDKEGEPYRGPVNLDKMLFGDKL